ncbi:ABC transporter ATP-binding protein YvcR [Paramagnetospirillum magnetotacticum MS-1]|uniref:ABC transporter ATP-binding protein YvcR n=1 Tax=Paramagnetospirillum magnetotacticum MS-1 TaxID=272627 RepID=A0A0C2YF70_PARME|nr:ABC transporter ATP-binding protein [Paramagnetospirillum magnetotacticum]KIL98359.1 ABC transporter ATP-binding protein YvcR [Paramagnetospirillum magnetotacticum MS-1]
MTEIAVQARAVTRDLPGLVPVTLVRDIDLSVSRGEFVAVTGPSGSGKSSLLYLLGLLDVPTSGSVWLQGQDTAGLNPDDMAALRLASIGFVFQFHFLLPEFTCQANVEIPIRRLGNLSDAQARDRAAELLDCLELADHRRKYPDQLSGGQRQRVAIARALANDPPLILADEPTGNLDTRTAHLVFEQFRDLAHRQNRTVLVVTHDAELAKMADRRIHLVDGRIVP